MFKTLHGISGGIVILPDGKVSFAIFNDNDELELGLQSREGIENYTTDFKAVGLIFDANMKNKVADILRFLATEIEKVK
jgi:hypothetical protein